MNARDIPFCGETLTLLPSGALHWASRELLAVADLHLGKSERIARRSGTLLPPYDADETLARLGADLDALRPDVVLCLGDSFDDLTAADAISETTRAKVLQLQESRQWIWLEGNHDPGPANQGGVHLGEFRLGPFAFRHIAESGAGPGEISGHFHPKARIRGTSRPCFMVDEARLILPAYGCYTGGLDWTASALRDLFSKHAVAYLTGTQVLPAPVPSAV
ncbi:MAG: ligase-associated DNA damage response endonuclease PdeM [Boseongicola sp.]|nr:ligase-associated DNA damage response endonuclease PdeM [Boseongicola sp.]